MTTSYARLPRRSALVAAFVLAAASTVSADSTPASAPTIPGTAANARTSSATTTTTRQARQARPQADPERHAYSWPVKPFDRQHPVRGFFGDPRIANHGKSRQFHFGVDISAPNDTPVYATLTGTVWIHPLHSTTVGVVGKDGVEFSYWHVVPAVHNGQRVTAYETVIGRIEAPYGHVHFSEARNGRYANPLRPGAMGPFVDETLPRIQSVVIERDGDSLIAEAYDATPLAVPRPWHNLPVMPALVRWRMFDAKGLQVRAWRTAVDFRMTIPSASSFDEVWAPGTTQNHVRAPGRYRLVLTRGLDELPADTYVVEVVARDVLGNATRKRFQVTLSGS